MGRFSHLVAEKTSSNLPYEFWYDKLEAIILNEPLTFTCVYHHVETANKGNLFSFQIVDCRELDGILLELLQSGYYFLGFVSSTYKKFEYGHEYVITGKIEKLKTWKDKRYFSIRSVSVR